MKIRSDSRLGRQSWTCVDRECPGRMGVARTTLRRADRGGDAGASAQAIFERERSEYADRIRYFAPVVAAVIVIIAGLGYLAALPLVGSVRASVIAIVVICVTVAALLRLPLSVVYWERGAAAERAAGTRLAGLEPQGFV